MAINFTSGSDDAYEMRQELSKHVEEKVEWKRQITSEAEEQTKEDAPESSYADIDVTQLLDLPHAQSAAAPAPAPASAPAPRPQTPEELYTDPKQWTVAQVSLWLEMMNLGQHAKAFANSLLDGHYLYSEVSAASFDFSHLSKIAPLMKLQPRSRLQGLTKGDLEELGVVSNLEQKRILHGQASLKNICDQLYPDNESSFMPKGLAGGSES